MKQSVPPYRLHKGTRQAYVLFDGRRTYLGRHDSPEARQRYDRLVAEWLSGGRQPTVESDGVTIVELSARFWRHVQDYYKRADGTPTSEIASFRLALRPLKLLYGSSLASEFGPKRLRAVRQRLIETGTTRKYVNAQVGRLRMMFRWAVAEELISPTVYQAIQAVAGLKRGRCDAKESEPVRPVPEADIAAVRPLVSRQVRGMIDLQLYTAARPGEIVLMRAVDFDMSGRVWTYQPAAHKTAHHGHRRLIYLGPKAQKIVRPFLSDRPVDRYLFSPAEAVAESIAAQHKRRTTPESCGNTIGSNRKRNPKTSPGSHYTSCTYRIAIRRACERAGVAIWCPHRLRHNAATALRKDFGLEAAQIMLGHKLLTVTQVYAEADRGKAEAVALSVG